VDSFIPLWEWDLPKKKSKKKRAEKGEKKEKGKSKNGAATTGVEEVAGDSDSQPIRGARIEEVPDEDA
jgi:translocation protein SEC62